MPREGRDFEQLVELIEKTLSDKNVKVQSPEYIKGKSGVKHEIDVTIHGHLQNDTIPYLIIIQCRERKKKGDVVWMQEIASKKEDIGANQAVAVSSSGFSPEAMLFAKENGIILRDMGTIDEEEILNWYNVLLYSDYPWYDFESLAFILSDESKKRFVNHIAHLDKTEDRYIKVADSTLGSPMFYRISDGKMLSLIDLFDSDIIRNKVMENVNMDGTKKLIKLHLTPSDMPDWYKLSNFGELFDISFFIAELNCCLKKIELQPKKYFRYQDTLDKQAIIDTVVYELDKKDGKEKIYFCFNHKSKESFIDIDGEKIRVTYPKSMIESRQKRTDNSNSPK